MDCAQKISQELVLCVLNEHAPLPSCIYCLLFHIQFMLLAKCMVALLRATCFQFGCIMDTTYVVGNLICLLHYWQFGCHCILYHTLVVLYL